MGARREGSCCGAVPHACTMLLWTCSFDMAVNGRIVVFSRRNGATQRWFVKGQSPSGCFLDLMLQFVWKNNDNALAIVCKDTGLMIVDVEVSDKQSKANWTGKRVCIEQHCSTTKTLFFWNSTSRFPVNQVQHGVTRRSTIMMSFFSNVLFASSHVVRFVPLRSRWMLEGSTANKRSRKKGRKNLLTKKGWRFGPSNVLEKQILTEHQRRSLVDCCTQFPIRITAIRKHSFLSQRYS